MNFKLLGELFDQHAASLSSIKSDNVKFRIASYKKVAGIIHKQTHPFDIATVDKINMLPITQYMKNKANEFISNKKEMTKKEMTKKKDPTNKKDTAYSELNPVAKIPHEFIQKFEAIIKKISTRTLKLTLVGSYRRKKPYSSDIDIMITSDKDNAIELFKNKIEKLFESRVYSQGSDRISMILIAEIPFKIDAFRTPVASEIPMLIYATGSKEFNIYMRGVAKRKGYLLNQKGIYENGKPIPNLKKEEDYFKLLSIPYTLPEHR